MLKNKFFALLIMLTLVSPVLAEPENTGAQEALTPISQEDVSDRYVSTAREELPVLDTIPHKQPVSKKKIAKKFLAAMAGVGISSIMLYLILTLYNKIRENLLQAKKEIPPEGETSLVTPDNLVDAVKTFLEKTKWQG